MKDSRENWWHRARLMTEFISCARKSQQVQLCLFMTKYEGYEQCFQAALNYPWSLNTVWQRPVHRAWPIGRWSRVQMTLTNGCFMVGIIHGEESYGRADPSSWSLSMMWELVSMFSMAIPEKTRTTISQLFKNNYSAVLFIEGSINE